MSYIDDPDLNFLNKVSNSDLGPLVTLLTFDSDGKGRYTEELTSHPHYKAYYPDHHQYWRMIAEEIQLFGGNTLINFFRQGKGVLYREILEDVCNKLGVIFEQKDSTIIIENTLLIKLVQDAYSKMSDKEKEDFAQSIGRDRLALGIVAGGGIGVAKGIMAAYGLNPAIMGKVMAGIAKVALGKGAAGVGIKFGATMMGPMLGFISGPLLSLAGVALIGHSITGEAYRVTIPAVIHIASIRQKYI